jgi:hypothetical protein
MAKKREAGRQCFARFQRGKMTSTSDAIGSIEEFLYDWKNIGNNHDVKHLMAILFSVKETTVPSSLVRLRQLHFQPL